MKSIEVSQVIERNGSEIYIYMSFQANVSSVMCAYNQVNGTSSCHNAALIGDEGYLRMEGFQGSTCVCKLHPNHLNAFIVYRICRKRCF